MEARWDGSAPSPLPHTLNVGCGGGLWQRIETTHPAQSTLCGYIHSVCFTWTDRSDAFARTDSSHALQFLRPWHTGRQIRRVPGFLCTSGSMDHSANGPPWRAIRSWSRTRPCVNAHRPNNLRATHSHTQYFEGPELRAAARHPSVGCIPPGLVSIAISPTYAAIHGPAKCKNGRIDVRCDRPHTRRH